MKNLNKIVHLFLNSLDTLQEKNILAGFSGGADSTALLDILVQKKDFFGFNLKAVFFSHGNSPIAKDEDLMREFCQNFCDKHHIELIEVDLSLEKIPRQGWESSGRQARLEFYQQMKADFVFLGHHQDDQNETTMTQLLRGAGKATGGMKKRDGMFCRPLLDIHKKDIYEYLTNKEIKWVEDPTNTDTYFTRNFWRNTGLPTIAQHYPNYSQSLENFREKYNELHDLAYELALSDGLNELVKKEPVAITSFNEKRLKNLLSHYFSAQGVHAEDSFYEQQIAHYMANNNVTIELGEHTLFLHHGMMSSLPLATSKKLKM
jgi:tRNA(Ile)-lysidine synthetase-like protein